MKVMIMLAWLFPTLALANWQQETWDILREYNYACRNAEVEIDEIVPNQIIKGHVKGLPAEALAKFKVIFYVKTNRWYIHPYAQTANQGPGYSYALIDENGTFSIKTVLRDVPASQLAAVVVPLPAYFSNQRRWLRPFLGWFGGILRNHCTYTLVKGNGDFLH